MTEEQCWQLLHGNVPFFMVAANRCVFFALISDFTNCFAILFPFRYIHLGGFSNNLPYLGSLPNICHCPSNTAPYQFCMSIVRGYIHNVISKRLLFCFGLQQFSPRYTCYLAPYLLHPSPIIPFNREFVNEHLLILFILYVVRAYPMGPALLSAAGNFDGVVCNIICKYFSFEYRTE